MYDGKGVVIYYHWPEDFVIPVDSVWIFETFGTFDYSNDYQAFRTGGWICDKVFKGAFIDRNTLRGAIFLGNCRGGNNNNRPASTTVRHLVTFHRL